MSVAVAVSDSGRGNACCLVPDSRSGSESATVLDLLDARVSVSAAGALSASDRVSGKDERTTESVAGAESATALDLDPARVITSVAGAESELARD